jgi:hypothetical protein
MNDGIFPDIGAIVNAAHPCIRHKTRLIRRIFALVGRVMMLG